VTDLSKIDVSNAEKLSGTLQAIADAVIESRKSAKEARDLATDLRKALDEKTASASHEVKQFGTEFGDTKAKIVEISTKMADAVGKISHAEQAIAKYDGEFKSIKDTIEALNLAIQKRGSADDETEKNRLAETKALRTLFDVKASESGIKFDRDVTDDDLANYREHKSAWGKMLRLPTTIDQSLVSQHLTPLEQKAVSTFSHGNRFWLPTELADIIIACYKMDTDLTGMVGQMMISRGSIDFMTDNYVSNQAKFKCEIDNSAQQKSDTQLPGSLNIAAHEQFAHECVTHTMIEDAAIDIQSWVAMRAGQQFVRGLNDKILNGTGTGMPDGVLRAANHITMLSGNVAGAPTGSFSCQDLQLMAAKLELRFQKGAIWWMATDALAAVMTMTDGFGRPIFSAAVINSEGLPLMMGHPVVQVVQMPAALQTVVDQGAFVPGTKPIMLGDWRQHYMLVIRRGFTALRNPYINSKNGVVWEFSQRVGGGVLCKNAAIALEIK